MLKLRQMKTDEEMNINKNNYEAFFLDYHEGNLSTQEVADLFLFLSQHPELKKEFEEFEHIILEDFSSPVFEHKDLLKKNITADNREEYFIRAIENTLDQSELILLDQFLKAHPEFLAEFHLFKKTKLQAEETVVFENKTHLKHPLAANDDYLISALEGLLSEQEQLLFEKRLTSDPLLQRSFALYQHTKFRSDNAVIYPDKESLKRKERKIIPLYYYLAAAASFALLIGLFFLWRTTNDATIEKRFAEQKKQSIQQQQLSPVKDQPASFIQKKNNSASSSSTNSDLKNKKNPAKKRSKRNSSVDDTPAETNTPVIEVIPLDNNPIASTDPMEKKQPVVDPVDSSNLHKHTTPVIAKIENKRETAIAPAYTSLRDILAIKLKEKLVGKDALQDAPNNSSKKISGWDIAGVLAKGLSRLTGKKIEVKPQFNSDGNVTAYALSAGKLEFSRIK